jgi:hypothetical protein
MWSIRGGSTLLRFRPCLRGGSTLLRETTGLVLRSMESAGQNVTWLASNYCFAKTSEA